MLEKGYVNSYDQGLQTGFEIGVSEAALDTLAVMAGRAKIFLSETKWKRYKKSEDLARRIIRESEYKYI